MANKPESRLQKKILKAVKDNFPGCFLFKTHGGPYQKAGIPDLVGSINGVFVGIEVKNPEDLEKVTKLQEITIGEINKSGGIAFVSSSVEHTLDELKIRLEEV